MTLRVLIIQSDIQSARALSRLVKNRDTDVWEAWEFGQARALLQQTRPEVIFLDLHFSGDEWLGFLKEIRQRYPQSRVVITNSYPDLKREMVAREMGVHVFLRQPFTRRWVENALERIQQPKEVVQEEELRKTEAAPKTMPRVRFPVSIKITLPYLILAILFALATAYLISQVVFDSFQDRYFNQLIATGRQTSDWMVREEDSLLSTLRLIANTQGVAEALQEGNAEDLRSLVLPLAVNTQEQAVDLLDMQGVSQLSLYRPAGADISDYQSERGSTFFRDEGFVQLVLNGVSDEEGDKYAGVVSAPWGQYFYVAGPVFAPDGTQVGVILVGNSLNRMAQQIRAETLGAATFYDMQGIPLQSTLIDNPNAYLIPNDQLTQVLTGQEELSITRDLTVSSVEYTELLGVWEARGGEIDLGVLGVSLPQAFLVQTSQVTRLQVFGLSLLGIMLVVLVGVWLANLITRPLTRLVGASTEVAQGNLDVKVEPRGNDEVAVLAHSFNEMIAGLQEGSIYRDILGRTVSPEVREQLRQTFSSGDLRLEGQEAVATVLMADVRGFTTLSEKASPATIFEWLNEYFGELIPIIVQHGGVVNKLDGDALLAFFGILPTVMSPRSSAMAGCQAAVDMYEAVEALNRKRKQRGDPPLITGIGVHTGEVMAGGLGSADRLHYTIIGDTVNTAQRIEGLTRDIYASGGVLVSQATQVALGEQKDRFNLEPEGLYTVRGKEEKIMVYRMETNTSAPKLEVML